MVGDVEEYGDGDVDVDVDGDGEVEVEEEEVGRVGQVHQSNDDLERDDIYSYDYHRRHSEPDVPVHLTQEKVSVTHAKLAKYIYNPAPRLHGKHQEEEDQERNYQQQQHPPPAPALRRLNGLIRTGSGVSKVGIGMGGGRRITLQRPREKVSKAGQLAFLFPP